MKIVLRCMFVIAATLVLFVEPVCAGGDKVRGDEGAGGVAQHQESEYPYERRP